MDQATDAIATIPEANRRLLTYHDRGLTAPLWADRHWRHPAIRFAEPSAREGLI
ncbi:MAG: hypothetical protein R3A44_28590 [Caldilineaceae bacterium]